MSSFADLGVPARPVRGPARRRGITEPFPIQAATSPTRSPGATSAGGPRPARARRSPSASRSSAVPAAAPEPRRPTALVLVPTRELAAQVQRELAPARAPAAARVAAVYGGVGYGPQRKALAPASTSSSPAPAASRT